MLKKSITYEDLEGNTVTEDFYFHLSKAELMELEWSKTGGMMKWIETISNSRDGAVIIAEFKKLILSAYGERSPDGRTFVKTQELRDRFEGTEAFSNLFMELATDADSATAFVNGMVPKSLEADIARLNAGKGAGGFNQRKHPSDTAAKAPPEPLPDTAPGNIFERDVQALKPQILTRREVIAMDSDELKAGLADGRFALAPTTPDEV